MAIRIKVLYFAQARQAAGTDAEEVVLAGPRSVGALVDRSMRAHQGLRAMASTMRVAVNEEIAAADRPLAEGDVVAFLPPVAGG